MSVQMRCRAVFKGHSAADAALCTESATYKLRQVEATNNSFLALAPEVWPGTEALSPVPSRLGRKVCESSCQNLLEITGTVHLACPLQLDKEKARADQQSLRGQRDTELLCTQPAAWHLKLHALCTFVQRLLRILSEARPESSSM